MKQRAFTCLLTVSISIIGFLTYRDVLCYYFTGEDTLSLIDTSRVHSFRDITRILTEPLLNGTSFLEAGSFYRPVAVLSYSIDYSIWGLNPFGYNLSNLILHIAVSVLIFFLVKALTNGDALTACLASLLFTLHPILVENLPSPERRQDILASLFLLLSFFLFLRYRNTTISQTRYLVFSIITCGLALGSKEIGIILPLLIIVYLALFPSAKGSAWRTLSQASKSALPYLSLMVLLLAWRQLILGGPGGYAGKSFAALSLKQIVLKTYAIVYRYVSDLIYPVDFLGSPFSFVPSLTEEIVCAIILLAALSMLFQYRRPALSIVWPSGNTTLGMLKLLFGSMVLISLAGIVAYPLLSAGLNKVLLQAYQGKEFTCLTMMMRGRESLPAEFYFARANQLWFSTLFTVFIISALSLLFIDRWYQVKQYFIHSDTGKIICFALTWLALPLGISLATLTFSDRTMYTPAIPFNILLAVILVDLTRSVVTGIGTHRGARSASRLIILSPALGLVFVVGLTMSLLLYSPLVRSYKEWEESGEFARVFFEKLANVIPNVPENAVLEIFDLPDHFSEYDEVVPHAKGVSFIGSYSIQSWLNLSYPANHIRVTIGSRYSLRGPLHSFDLTETVDGRHTVKLFLKPDISSN